MDNGSVAYILPTKAACSERGCERDKCSYFLVTHFFLFWKGSTDIICCRQNCALEALENSNCFLMHNECTVKVFRKNTYCIWVRKKKEQQQRAGLEPSSRSRWRVAAGRPAALQIYNTASKGSGVGPALLIARAPESWFPTMNWFDFKQNSIFAFETMYCKQQL
jgi:hypothetical protein